MSNTFSKDLLEIKKVIKKNYPNSDLSVLEEAFYFSKITHKNQKRKSGEPYFIHPLNIAKRMAKDGLGEIIISAALLHDIIEELGMEYAEQISNLDEDGPEVLKLVLEVSRNKNIETKEEYLDRLKNATYRAKILKCADRISNLTDLHSFIYTPSKILSYLVQTEIYIMPLANEVDENFVKELTDLIYERKKQC